MVLSEGFEVGSCSAALGPSDCRQFSKAPYSGSPLTMLRPIGGREVESAAGSNPPGSRSVVLVPISEDDRPQLSLHLPKTNHGPPWSHPRAWLLGCKPPDGVPVDASPQEWPLAMDAWPK